MNESSKLYIQKKIGCVEMGSHCYQPVRGNVSISSNINISKDFDYIIHCNELGIDLEKSINSKIASIYII